MWGHIQVNGLESEMCPVSWESELESFSWLVATRLAQTLLDVHAANLPLRRGLPAGFLLGLLRHHQFSSALWVISTGLQQQQQAGGTASRQGPQGCVATQLWLFRCLPMLSSYVYFLGHPCISLVRMAMRMSSNI